MRATASKHLSTFAARAYRRPLHEAEAAGLMALYDQQIESGKDFEGACRLMSRWSAMTTSSIQSENSRSSSWRVAPFDAMNSEMTTCLRREKRRQ